MRASLQDLLSTKKIIPFYNERKVADLSGLGPIAVELHWTSDCNYDCIHCSYGSRRQSKGRLSDIQIDGLVKDLINAGAKAVYISGGGEPTVVKGWDRYASMLIDSGVQVSLITNGVLLSAKNLYVLGRMNYVAISVYSDNIDQYRKITGSRFYDKQWDSPGLIKAAGGSAIVGCRCVINKINYRNVVNVYDKAKASGYDYIIFIPAVDYEGTGVGLSEEEQLEVINQVSANREAFDPSFSNILNVVDRGVWHYEQRDYRRDDHSEVGCSCIQYKTNAFVNYCGGVWLCQPHIGAERYKIGDLATTRFSNIWAGPTHDDVIKRLHLDYKSGLCRDCRSIGFNRAIADYEGLGGDVSHLELDPFV